LEKTVQELREHWKEIKALPDSGTPGKLKTEIEELLELIGERLGQDNFYTHAADLKTALTDIKTMVEMTIPLMIEEQKQTLQNVGQELQRMAEWSTLTQEEQSNTLAELEGLEISVSDDLIGMRRLLNQGYSIQYRMSTLKLNVVELAKKHEEIDAVEPKHVRVIKIPSPHKKYRTIGISHSTTPGLDVGTKDRYKN